MSFGVRVALAATLAVLALVPLGAARAQSPALIGTVGPGFTISLTRADGTQVRRLDPGTYVILVRDRADIHNFHLFGPGVDRRSSVEGTGEETWTVTFTNGVYTYRCDPHRATLIGDFTVGTAIAPPAAPRLFGKVGPGRTITLTNAAGRRVKVVKPGPYKIVVRDRTKTDNFHLLGRGVNKRTGVAFKGSTTWLVKLRAGAVYRYFSDPHRTTMKGSFRVSTPSPPDYGY